MTADLGGLLAHLLDAHVDFILVGGFAAVMQGASFVTRDVDIVHEREPTNVDRLLSVLVALHATVREPGDRRLPPDRDALLGAGHNLFRTDLGPLDCLCTIEGGADFRALRPRAIEIPFRGVSLCVLELEALLELKERRTDERSLLRAADIRDALNARPRR